MVVNFKKFTELLERQQKDGKLTKAEVTTLRNQVATLSQPKCPPKFASALCRIVNMKLGEVIVS